MRHNRDRSRRRRAPLVANQAGVLDAVRIVLSGVARTRGRSGKQLLAQMLCGSSSEKVIRMKFNTLSTYGLLAHLRQTEAVDLIDALIAVRYIEQVDVDRFRPVLQLTADGQAVMAGRVDSLVPLSLAVGLVEKLRRGCSSGSGSVASSGRSLAGLDSHRPTSLVAFGHGSGDSSSGTLRCRAAPSPIDSVPTTPMAAPWLAGRLMPILTCQRAKPPAASPRQPLPPAGSQPSHYWTWRLLTAGFAPEECAAIRGLSADVVLDHALRAADCGWPVQAEWFCRQV